MRIHPSMMLGPFLAGFLALPIAGEAAGGGMIQLAQNAKGFDGEWVGILKSDGPVTAIVCGFKSHPIKAFTAGKTIKIITQDKNSNVTLHGNLNSNGSVEFSGPANDWKISLSEDSMGYSVSSHAADVEGQITGNKFEGSIVAGRGDVPTCYTSFSMERKIDALN